MHRPETFERLPRSHQDSASFPIFDSVELCTSSFWFSAPLPSVVEYHFEVTHVFCFFELFKGPLYAIRANHVPPTPSQPHTQNFLTLLLTVCGQGLFQNQGLLTNSQLWSLTLTLNSNYTRLEGPWEVIKPMSSFRTAWYNYLLELMVRIK